jgi:hypothetical protein
VTISKFKISKLESGSGKFPARNLTRPNRIINQPDLGLDQAGLNVWSAPNLFHILTVFGYLEAQ